MTQRIPRILYKYRSWQEDIPPENQFHRKLITDCEIYFPSPIEFNDPYDTAIVKRYDLLKDQKAYDFFYSMAKDSNPEFDEKQLVQERNRLYDKHQEIPLDDLKKMGSDYAEKFKNNHGVLSLCKKNDDILMWSHYGNCHKGFCIGFDTYKLKEFIKETKLTGALLPITYTNKYPIIIPKADESDVKYNIFIQLTTKYKKWSYEKEYRYVIIEKPSMVQKIDSDIIKSITFGCDIDKESEKEIKKLLRSKFPNIEQYKTIKSEDEFKLIIIRMH